MWYFLSLKVDAKMIFTDYWKVLVLIFLMMGNTVFFWVKKLMEKMIFTDYWKVLVLNFSVMGNMIFFSAKKLVERWYLLGIFELPMIFQDLGNTVFRAVQMAVSICRYQSLSHSPPHQNFGSYFLVFGKCGVTPYRLYSDSLSLSNKQLLSNCRTFMNLRVL